MKSGCWTLALAAIVAAGCAGPKHEPFPTISEAMPETEANARRLETIAEQAEQQYRVLDVAYPILVHNTDFCGNLVGPEFGMRLVNANTFDSYDEEWQEAAVRHFDADKQVMIAHVVDDSPADLAGLQAGDRLVSLNGKPFPQGAGAVASTERMLRRLQYEPAAFVVHRNGEDVELAATPIAACKYPLLVLQDSVPNAYADDTQIMVTSGMLGFVKNDVELATVISHELAHNVMGHVDAREANTTAGAAGGLLLDVLFALAGVNTGGAFMRSGMNSGAASYSMEFEEQADYVGMYMLARAGYDYNQSVALWERRSGRTKILNEGGTTHPTSTARFIAMDSAAQEIYQKQLASLPLLPELDELPEPRAVNNQVLEQGTAKLVGGGRDGSFDDGDTSPLETAQDVPIGNEDRIIFQAHGESWGPIRLPTD